MIFYLVRAQNARMAYVNSWGPTPGSRMQFLFYEDIVQGQRFRPGTYIFADLETLSPGQLQLAGELDEQLTRAGGRFRTLNHPARVLRRIEALNKLHETGINSFRAVWASDSLEGIRFPVFLRRADDHRGSLTPLLQDRAALARGLKYVRLQGNRLSEILVVEFCDTSDKSGVFRKYSAFLVDKQVLPRHLIFGQHWNLKQPSLKTEKLNQEQLDYLQTNPHAGFIADIFKRTNIDYGRIDYSMAGNVPQVWEINTHPTVLKITPRLTAAFEAIDLINNDLTSNDLSNNGLTKNARADNDEELLPVSFRDETLAQVKREMRSRARGAGVRKAVADLGSTAMLQPVKRMLKKWLA